MNNISYTITSGNIMGRDMWLINHYQNTNQWLGLITMSKAHSSLSNAHAVAQVKAQDYRKGLVLAA